VFGLPSPIATIDARSARRDRGVKSAPFEDHLDGGFSDGEDHPHSAGFVTIMNTIITTMAASTIPSPVPRAASV
jgi:hypothetical protein